MFSISPIDSRHFDELKELRLYFSEFAIVRKCIEISIEYIIQLSKFLGNPDIIINNYDQDLRHLYTTFDEHKFSSLPHHTVRVNAISDYLATYFEQPDWINFGIPATDINSLAVKLLFHEALTTCIYPRIEKKGLICLLDEWGRRYNNTKMLTRVHGQPATPTNLGTRFMIFANRLSEQMTGVERRVTTDFGGDMNEHRRAFPHKDWRGFINDFIKTFGLTRSYPDSTEPFHLSICNAFTPINTILVELCHEMRHYLSLHYFKYRNSSDKPTTIDFDNVEDNLRLANTLFNHFSTPRRCDQYELEDMTVPLAYSFLAYKQVENGLKKLEVNYTEISRDLQTHWDIILQSIHTIVRQDGEEDSYDKVKTFISLLTDEHKAVNIDDIMKQLK